jgi:heme/copper-type cytochrome/quinol oxidase subunit 2
MNLKRLTVAAYFVATVLSVLCYLGSVRSTAVWIYLLPAAVITAVATAAPRKPTTYAGLTAGLTCGMIWAVMVNSLSGENLGPVARSTSACIIGATLVVFGMRRREPNTSLIGQLLVMFGALYYGAANEVWKLALVAMLFQLAGYVGSSHIAQNRRPQEHSRRKLLMLLVLLLTSIVIILATPWKLPGILSRDNPRQSVILSNTDVKPPWNSPKTTTTTLAGTSPTTDVSSVPKAPEVDKQQVDWSLIALIVVLTLLFIVCALLLRMLYVHVRFTRTTKKWCNQEARSSISASWLWTTRVLRTYAFSFSPATPLESIGKDESVKGWPEEIREPMMQLAEICGNAAYKREVPTDEAHTQVWDIANSLKQEANRNAKWWRRVAFRFMRVLP